MAEVDEITPLAIELVSAARERDEEELIDYVKKRLQEEVTGPMDLIRIVTFLAVFGASTVNEWAADTGTDPNELMQTIALTAAQSVYNDDET